MAHRRDPRLLAEFPGGPSRGSHGIRVSPRLDFSGRWYCTSPWRACIFYRTICHRGGTRQFRPGAQRPVIIFKTDKSSRVSSTLKNDGPKLRALHSPTGFAVFRDTSPIANKSRVFDETRRSRIHEGARAPLVVLVNTRRHDGRKLGVTEDDYYIIRSTIR